MNKKNLYNKIIESISKEIKKTLNEKAGVIEFNNFAYRKQIQQIVKELKNTTLFTEVLNIKQLSNYKFAKFTYDFSNILTWLKTLNVYYTITNGEFDAAAMIYNDDECEILPNDTDEEVEEKNKIKKVFIKNNGIIELGTIYIIDNHEENILFVLFHELCHLYDQSKAKKLWMEDENYFFRRRHKYDINEYKLRDDVNNYSLEDIHNIITESMYYANYTESHAFMENINFEIFEYLNKRRKEFYAFNLIDEFFYASSYTLYGIYILEKLLEKLKNISQEKKEKYIKIYSDDINLSYYKFDTFDKVVNYQYKKLHKIVSHSRSLFNYYFNLDSKALESFKLDEELKRNLMRSTDSTVLHRRKIDLDDLNIIK